ncbi:hypothetical protein H7J50_19435 [Mycobacterium intermedium]|uniref:hypothetical protein n=1 Tax=Mycobacterium TaxID=1763 RepID=UPI0012EA0C25|nr:MULTISPECIES: hypothetical protein [Mycobacterium]MCV6965966.1 hypothetical protein [Mycobacterium intermedium]MCV6977600.1 hypothetical protein [Mycobacterium bourgelatii]
MPTGTCTPSQLQGSQVCHATSPHCCSGVSGLGPAQGGVAGPPQTLGSADATPKFAKVVAPIANVMAAAAEQYRMRFMASSNLSKIDES